MIEALNADEIGLDEQILCCPKEALSAYLVVMDAKKIPYKTRLDEKGDICFILPKKYRPHAWKLKFYRSRVR